MGHAAKYRQSVQIGANEMSLAYGAQQIFVYVRDVERRREWGRERERERENNIKHNGKNVFREIVSIKSEFLLKNRSLQWNDVMEDKVK